MFSRILSRSLSLSLSLSSYGLCVVEMVCRYTRFMCTIVADAATAAAIADCRRALLMLAMVYGHYVSAPVYAVVFSRLYSYYINSMPKHNR